jgi:hypothetical protein
VQSRHDERPIVYGACVGSTERFEAIAEASIRKHAPGAPIIVRTGQGSICAAYNSILDEALAHEPASVVLIHEDVELQDPHFEENLRALLAADPEIGLVGAIGGRNPRDMAWWDSTERVGSVRDTFWTHQASQADGDVDALDGILIAFSPWALRHLRFDAARFKGFHGYDADVCRQARAAGKRVVVLQTGLFHHTSSPAGSATHAWHEALYAWRAKWVRGSRRTRAAWFVKRLGHGLLARLGR